MLGSAQGLNGWAGINGAAQRFTQSPIAQNMGLGGTFEQSAGAQQLGLGGSYQASPGYQWQLGQGVAARDQSAASKGLLNSGAQMKALTEYGQGVANQDYGQWADRATAARNTYNNNLSSGYDNFLSNLGGTANTGANTAGQISNMTTALGGAQTGAQTQIGANKTQGVNGVAGLLANLAGSAAKAYAGKPA